MDIKEVLEILGEDWISMKARIVAALRTDITLLQITNDSILKNSGKMLRPMLSLLCARLCSGGKVNDDSLRYAASSELLHNATLLHDDVADGSATRRGAPTVMSLLGPSAAVLVGDFWLSRSVELLLNSEHHEEVVRMFAKTISNLAEGEMLQLQKAGSVDTTEEDYYRIIYCKTASLFEAACMSGAVSVDATPAQKEAVRIYADALGKAFQIKDDILDYDGNEELGKPVGVDIKEQKITLPLLGAMANSDKAEEIRACVRDIVDNPGYCDQITAFVKVNGGIEYAAARLDEFIERAKRALDIFPDSPEKTALVALAEFNVLRRK